MTSKPGKQKSKALDATNATRPTTFHGYRFDDRLWSDFQKSCDRHLSNPRAVMEALMLEWMRAEEDWRLQVAKKYVDWTQHSL